MQAHHVWLPEVAASAFPAVAESLDASLAPEASVSIASLPSLEHVLFDARGRHHVVLRANGAALQLVIEGADVTRGAVAITLLVRGFGAIRQASTHLETLRQILAPASRRRLLPHWTATTLKQRAALVALDGRDAGASYREVATVLHGVDHVERYWKTGLKERMRHDLTRGLALAGGGYRKLLS